MPAIAPVQSELFKIEYQGRNLWLTDGRFSIGRSVLCNIVVDDARVSPYHARVEAAGSTLTIEDLGSANGTFVNGSRLPQGPVPLGVGDLIVVGGLEMTVGRAQRPTSFLPPARLPSPHPERQPDSHGPVLPSIRAGVEEPNPTAPDRADSTELLGAVAEPAFAAGQPGDAQRILGPHIERVLGELRAERPVSERQFEWATKYSLRLAIETRDGRWVDTTLKLLASRGHALLPDPEMELLESAIDQCAAIDLGALSEYVAQLRSRPGPAEVTALRWSHRLEPALLKREGA